MNTEGRHAYIVELVLHQGSVTIEELSEKLLISEMTARRDLTELDRRGLLKRVRGGAVSNLGRSYEPPFLTRASKNQAAKEKIGAKAAEFIFDGNSVVLDSGTTVMEIVPWPKEKHNLTVVTNCLKTAARITNLLALESDARLILTGGVVRPNELSMVGPLSEPVLNSLHVDVAFIGIGGIHVDEGLTEFNLEDAQTKKKLLNAAGQKIVVADSSKFGVTAFASVGPFSQIDRIITDESAPAGMIEKIRKQGVDVVVVD